ncbi:MAG: hypothetical protein F9K43_27185 [Bauldia sp.]|nr:MAG: hypothetical protein F9K43_27185 [Bauldia sp.]
MMFVRFDAATGAIVGWGVMDAAHIDAEIAAGGSILVVDRIVNPDDWRVDPATRTLVDRR